jgi:tellurite resistance protein TehA-like permease
METVEIFGVQFVLSVIVFALIAKWHVAPWLSEKPIQVALGILILPHAFRHIGLTFLTPAVVNEAMPSTFAIAAGYGDFASGILAILALVALHRNLSIAIGLVWTFSIVGTVDLLSALRQVDAVPHFGAAWYIPTFLVPLLIVTHVMVFVRLLKRNQTNLKSTQSHPASARLAR